MGRVERLLFLKTLNLLKNYKKIEINLTATHMFLERQKRSSAANAPS